jgi:chromosome segregation protein
VRLRSLRLRGFKSFPDTLELKLEPGVSVVVGPNGSGKSNVADAIVWAAGSLTPSELRAERPDDVLFNGACVRGRARAAARGWRRLRIAHVGAAVTRAASI